MSETFEAMLTGGHPNSLGRTEEVVALVLADPDRFDELFECYKSEDEVVRLRVSSAMKRIEPERRDLIMAYLDRFISEIGALDQASAQWTLAQLFERIEPDMSAQQKQGALAIMKRNLAENSDWIVLNMTMATLTDWSADDADLRQWLKPQLERHANDTRKSVAKRAGKLLKRL
ncbi:hypothetical protein [uncultured Erythrobacter sp.]|uniref:hypothetical protein n=1 Tax=uncultured Erythrobacter sp. TaxID=263913 RepID=UPI0026224C80|nr:hypothetical protein [uncultured Erythrobacter sp.]